MKKKLDQLSEKDFLFFRIPHESGRQSPKNMKHILITSSIITILLLGLLNVFVFIDRFDPPHQVIVIISLIYNVVGVSLIGLAIAFSFKKIYQKRQKFQYLLVALFINLVYGPFFYIIGLYILTDPTQFHHRMGISASNLILLITVTLLIGLGIFVYSYVHTMKLLQQGKFRKGTERYKKQQTNERNEPNTYIGSVAALLSGTLGNGIYLTRRYGENMPDDIVIFIMFGAAAIYVLMLLLPRQLVILYCKGRFKSFQFNDENELNPVGSSSRRYYENKTT